MVRIIDKPSHIKGYRGSQKSHFALLCELNGYYANHLVRIIIYDFL